MLFFFLTFFTLKNMAIKSLAHMRFFADGRS
jgi:hypothetical protein